MVTPGAALPTSKEALTKLDAQLTCAICLDRYTDPRSLPCLHSYCKDCIDHFPVDPDNGRHVVKCPSCRKTTQLSERGAAALPVNFYINNLLDIDELLKKASSSNGEQQLRTCHAHNNRPEDIYCDTCEELVCLKCVSESHSNHKYDRADSLFTKHKKQIEACLQPVKKRIDEVEQTLAHFDTREGEMREQEKAVQKRIDDTYQQLVNELQESRRKLSQEAAADLQEKLQLHSVQRGNVEAVLVQLKSCCEFVEEKLRSQLQYQIQAAKTQLVKHIYDTHSEVKMSELQPAQEPNIVFTANKNTPSACRHIGDISSKQSFSCPGFFSVGLPSTMHRKEETMLVLTAPISFSATRLCCQLTPAQGRDDNPVVCSVTGVGEDQFSISIQPFTTGLHHLRMLVDGVDIYGSPFPVQVKEERPHNRQDTWYIECDRAEARSRLQGKLNGTFLCRPSGGTQQTSNEGLHTHTIDIVYDGIKHIKVVQDGEKYGFSVPCQFLSLLELVLYYSDISLETHNPVLTTTLAYPINTT